MALADVVKFQTHACYATSDGSISPFCFDPEVSGRGSGEAYSPIKCIPPRISHPIIPLLFLCVTRSIKFSFLVEKDSLLLTRGICVRLFSGAQLVLEMKFGHTHKIYSLL